MNRTLPPGGGRDRFAIPGMDDAPNSRNAVSEIRRAVHSIGGFAAMPAPIFPFVSFVYFVVQFFRQQDMPNVYPWYPWSFRKVFLPGPER